jgi:hypothetical protein
MNSDFEELLNLFTANGVRYLVIGGHAAMAGEFIDSKSGLVPAWHHQR